MTTDQFAESIKAKYPQYQSLSNQELASKMLAKYPQYQSQITEDFDPAGLIPKTASQALPSTGQAQNSSWLNQDLLPGITKGVSLNEIGSRAKGAWDQFSGFAKQGFEQAKQGVEGVKQAFTSPETYIAEQNRTVPTPQGEERGFLNRLSEATSSLGEVAAGGGKIASSPVLGAMGAVQPEIGATLEGYKEAWNLVPEEQRKQVETSVQNALNAVPEDVKRNLSNAVWSMGLMAVPTELTATGKGIEYLGRKVASATSKLSNYESAAAGAVKKTIGLPASPKNEVALNLEIDKAIEKGLRPSVKGKTSVAQIGEAKEKAREAIKTIVNNKSNLKYTDETGEIVKEGMVPENLNEAVQALHQTKKAIYNQYNSLSKGAGETGVKINTKFLSKELKELSKDKTKMPTVRKYAQEQAKWMDEMGEISPEQLENVIADLNQSGVGNIFSTGASKLKAQVDLTMASRLRNWLDDTISSKMGSGYQDLKNQYGYLKSIEKDLLNRAIVDARKNTKGFFDVTDIFSGGDITAGVISSNPALIAKGLAQKGIMQFFKTLNDPNHVIKNLFKMTDEYMTSAPATGVGFGEGMSNLAQKGASTLYKTSEVLSKDITPQLQSALNTAKSAVKGVASDTKGSAMMPTSMGRSYSGKTYSVVKNGEKFNIVDDTGNVTATADSLEKANKVAKVFNETEAPASAGLPEEPLFKKADLTASTKGGLIAEARKYKSAEEFLKVIKPKDYNYTDKFGGTLSATIKGDTALIYDAFAREGGHGVYNNAIKDLANRGVKTIEVPLQTVDSTGALNSLLRKGILKNPRGGDPRVYGGGRHTKFDIVDSKTKSQLTDIWNKANKGIDTELEALKAEARKYKTAEEFVKDYGETAIPRNIIREQVLPKIAEADKKNYTIKIGNVGDLIKDDKIRKILKDGLDIDVYAVGEKIAREGNFRARFISDDIAGNRILLSSKIQNVNETIIHETIHGLRALKGKGNLEKTAEIGGENIKNLIRTKSQLTDIWNKAHPSKVVVEQLAEQAGGWKEGMKVQFDRAIRAKDAVQLKALLPQAPKEYVKKFSKEISDILSFNK